MDLGRQVDRAGEILPLFPRIKIVHYKLTSCKYTLSSFTFLCCFAGQVKPTENVTVMPSGSTPRGHNGACFSEPSGSRERDERLGPAHCVSRYGTVMYSVCAIDACHRCLLRDGKRDT